MASTQQGYDQSLALVDSRAPGETQTRADFLGQLLLPLSWTVCPMHTRLPAVPQRYPYFLPL
jgi:hypothetical protein